MRDQGLFGNLCENLCTFRDEVGMDSTIQKTLSCFEESSSKDNNWGGSVTSFDILGLGNFDKLNLDRSTIFAVGWTTSSFWRIVAPSLVMRISPRPSLIILSIPLGPRLVLMQSATAELMGKYLWQLGCWLCEYPLTFNSCCMQLAWGWILPTYFYQFKSF